jgi:hypothetical protein
MLVFYSLLLFLCQTQKAAPKISFDKTRHNFVKLLWNQIAEHTLDLIMTARAKADMYQEKITLRPNSPEQSELGIGIADILGQFLKLKN